MHDDIDTTWERPRLKRLGTLNDVAGNGSAPGQGKSQGSQPSS